MATYPVIQIPTLPTVSGKVITNVDSNGLNPIANMVIKMLEKCDKEFADALSTSQSTRYYNIAIPYGFVASEYDNEVFFGYDNSSPTRPLQVNITTNRFIRQMQNLNFVGYSDGDVITLAPESEPDQGQALASPLYTGTELFYYNFSATEQDVTPFFAEPYTSTLRAPRLYRGQPGSRSLVNSSLKSMYLILKFRGFKTCHIMDGEYMHTPTLIDGDVYLYVNIPSLFYRLGGAVYNYMDDPEITKSFFDNDIKVICSVPPAVTYPQITTPPRMIKADLDKLFNTIAIPFTYDPAQVQNETFTDGYDPKFVYVEKGGEDPEPPDGETGQPDNESGGGDGTGDNTQDNFEIPTPTFNPASAAVNQYVLNSQQVYSFLEELFNGTFWTNSDLLNKNPKESVISLTAWPINLLNWDLRHVDVRQPIVCGNVTMEYAQGQQIQNGYNKVVDIGEYEIKPYFGSFMDYLTKIEIFLPFIGWRNLSTQNVMGRTIKIKYVLNFEDGGIVVYITSTDGTTERLEQVEQAKLAFDLPVFTSNINEKEKDKLQLLMTAAISTVTAGVGAFGSGAGGVAAAAGTAAGKEVVSGASKIAAWQDHINGGSVVASNATWYLPNKCILKFTRPRKSEPSGYGRVNGYPANYTAKLGDVTGYTEVDNPVINGIECTENERQKIKSLLQGGIYL